MGTNQHETWVSRKTFKIDCTRTTSTRIILHSYSTIKFTTMLFIVLHYIYTCINKRKGLLADIFLWQWVFWWQFFNITSISHTCLIKYGSMLLFPTMALNSCPVQKWQKQKTGVGMKIYFNNPLLFLFFLILSVSISWPRPIKFNDPPSSTLLTSAHSLRLCLVITKRKQVQHFLACNFRQLSWYLLGFNFFLHGMYVLLLQLIRY